MFIKKITGIKSIGRFRTVGISGGEYGKYTLFYAGNGRGKTTLCAILRSLQTNDPSFVLKRRSFGSQTSQEAQFLLDSGIARFSGGAWNSQAPDIHIFDQHFIKANVHGGHQIDVAQRRNFYRIVVGSKGVALAEELDALDTTTTTKQQEITSEKRVLQQHVPKGMTLEAFLKLASDPSIDTKIAEAEKTVKAVEGVAVIAGRAKLMPVKLPALPADFETLMAKNLADVEADAAARVQAQIEAHGFSTDGEEWLRTGLRHVREEACPFCGTSVSGNILITAYQGYFSAAYDALKADLVALKSQLDADLGQAAGLRASQGFKEAATDAGFWSTYVDHGYVSPDEAAKIVIQTAVLHAAASTRLASKLGAPLESAAVTPEFTSALAGWAENLKGLEQANTAMAAANAKIEKTKQVNAGTNAVTARANLAKLAAIKVRHSQPFLSLADGYNGMLSDKEKLVAKKEAKKTELDTYDADILGSYEKEINAVLGRFNAGFRIANCGKNYVGKVPQSEYCLQFDGNDVDVTRPDGSGPSFDSSMSAGDKSTFALAFFLAQLNRDPDVSNKVVVFDDPFTSLDDFRREMTAKAIVRVGEAASQVMVFSHDKYFLDAVRQKIQGGKWVAMQVSGTKGNATIEPWDIDREVKEGYLQDHMELSDFANGITNDAKSMRTMMRPLLEKYIRYRFPNQIQDNHWLGDMLAIIRDDQDHPLKAQYQEIDDINGYTAPFHHDPNTAFDPDEVLAHVKRTLLIVGGC